MVIQSDTSKAELSSANPGGKGPGGFLEAGRCELSLQGRGAELGVGVTVASALGGCVEGVQPSVPRVSGGCFPVGSRPLRHSGGAVVVVGAACRSLGGMGCNCPLCVSPHPIMPHLHVAPSEHAGGPGRPAGQGSHGSDQKQGAAASQCPHLLHLPLHIPVP